MKFRVPHESSPPVLVELLERAWPEASRDDCYSVIGSGFVRVDGRLVKNPRRTLDPDLLVEVADVTTEEVFGVPEASCELSRGEGWVAVEKPVGMPGVHDEDDPMSPVAFLADVLGADRDAFEPVWTMPTHGGGPWLCAESNDDAQRLRDEIAGGDLETIWVAICPQFGLPTGEIEGDDGFGLRYAAVRMLSGLVELQLMPNGLTREIVADFPERLLELLATQGAPVLGDRERGGYMVPGGLRLRLMSLYGDDVAEGWVPPGDWLPEEQVVAQIEPTKPAQKPKGIRPFQVSAKTLEVIRTGHPWALPDAQTSSTRDYQPGEVVRLKDPKGNPGPFALIDGKDEVAARVWSPDTEAAQDFAGEVALRLDEAFGRRGDLFRDLDRTDLFRIVHGEADGLPGFLLDRVGSLYRATLVGGSAWGFREDVYQAIEDTEPEAMILEVAHLEDVRSQGELPQARIVNHGAHYAKAGERVVAHEEGLRYYCEPWEGMDVGFFADQRENRKRAREFVAEGRTRWLNLFCHTGAYTVALVDAGAEVVSNDLSQRYLDWLDRNLKLNHLDRSKNTNVAADAREVVADDSYGMFDGIIVDPPTAARSDIRFWSVKKDYEDLLVACFERLADGGVMLVCRNARDRKPALDDLVRNAAERAGRTIKRTEPAPPGPDYPTMPGFPEGDSFEGIWVVT